MQLSDISKVSESAYAYLIKKKKKKQAPASLYSGDFNLKEGK